MDLYTAPQISGAPEWLVSTGWSWEDGRNSKSGWDEIFSKAEDSHFQLSSIRWTAINWTYAREDTRERVLRTSFNYHFARTRVFPLRPPMNWIRALVAYSASLWPETSKWNLARGWSRGPASNAKPPPRSILPTCSIFSPSPPSQNVENEAWKKSLGVDYLPIAYLFLTHVTNVTVVFCIFLM